MLVGYFAVGVLAKGGEPGISPGRLALAAMLADLLWCTLMPAGVEHVQFKPAITFTGALS